MKRYNQLSLVASLLLAQCSSDANRNATVAMHTESGLKDTTEYIKEKLHMEEAIKKFGDPFKRDSFVMSQGLSEFRINLYNSIDQKEYINTPIMIQELTWKTGKETFTTIWYKKDKGKWVPVDLFVYTKNQYF